MVTYEDLLHLPKTALAGRYYKVAVQTRHNFGEPSHCPIRANPIPGQGFPTDLNVECSRAVREKYPVGSIFILWARLSCNSVNGAFFLYSYFNWATQKVTRAEAEMLIENHEIGLHNFYTEPSKVKI